MKTINSILLLALFSVLSLNSATAQTSNCSGLGKHIVPVWKAIYKTSHSIGKQFLKKAPLPNEVTFSWGCAPGKS